MQVTIDTRHDTLEEALAVIQLAFADAREPASASSGGSGRRGTNKTAAKNTRSSKSAKEADAPAVRKASTGKRTATSRGDRRSNIAPPGQADLVRAWARAQGMEVKPAGRLSAAVVSAYNAAH
jgi:Lsr2